MAELVWTHEALLWLRDIHDYIAADDPNAALRTVEGIFARAQDLRLFPSMGYRYAGSARNVRILLYDHYRIAYTVDGSDVTVLGVFHGALDIDRYEF